MKELPPLRALVAFEAAARHLSFANAADELHVTPGAVGQLIHKLEDWLGVKLFHRAVRQVTLTEAGAAYCLRISTALGQIAHASTALRQRQHSEVRISMPPSFARKWFVPRMARFMDLHPGINLHFNASEALVDFDNEPFDVAIRHFRAQQSNALDVELLFMDELRIYCSPSYCKKLKLKQPENLEKATLLATKIHPYWDHWAEQCATLMGRELGKIPSIYCDQSHLAIDAARRHQGIVLTSAQLVEQEVANGELIEPVASPLAVEEGYYLVSTKGSFSSEGAMQALRLWLKEECGNS